MKRALHRHLVTLFLLSTVLVPLAVAQGPSERLLVLLHDFYYRAGVDGHSGTVPTPTFIRDNKAYLETIPFDGLGVYMRDPGHQFNASTALMLNTPMSYENIAWVLSPIKNLQFTSLKNNYAFVTINRPADFFDNWSVAIQNFRNMARAVREAGLRGVFFDNEQYFGKLGDYPTHCKYPSRSLDAYREQARLRGRQLMQAMIAEFPNIEIMVFHGPYISEPNCPYWVPDRSRPLFQRLDFANELQAPVYVGMVQGARGTQAKVIEGGEMKGLRVLEDFELAHDFRKHGIAEPSLNSPVVIPALRPTWATDSLFSFTVFDTPWGGRDMNPGILKTTLSNALRTAEHMVWVYTERAKFLLPPSNPRGASIQWHNAVRDGIAAVYGSDNPPPGPPPPPPPGPPPPPPSGGAVEPSSGTGSRSAFSFRFSPRGVSSLTEGNILVSTSAAQRQNACWIHYNRSSNLIFLASDNIGNWQSHPFGVTGALENSQCIVHLGGSSLGTSGSDVTLNMTLTFRSAFRGAKTIFTQTLDTSGVTGDYQPGGVWNVP